MMFRTFLSFKALATTRRSERQFRYGKFGKLGVGGILYYYAHGVRGFSNDYVGFLVIMRLCVKGLNALKSSNLDKFS